MNTRAVCLLLGLTLLSGCGGSGVTPPAQTRASNTADAGIAPAQNAGPARTGQPGDGVPGVPSFIPEGNFTIMCQNFIGAGHERQARLAKDTYIKTTGREQFFVFHDTDHSELLFGGYKTNDASIDPVETQRAEADLKWLRSLKGPAGHPVFGRSLLVPLPTADPSGNPEWNLANIDRDKPRDDPNRKYWSLVIAAYTADVMGLDGRPGDRKQMAVDAVKQARAMGIEAYYYHGPSVSQVCIGAWPRRAMAEQESNEASSKSESAANSGESLVVSSVPLPEEITKDLQNRGQKVIQPRIDVRDPNLAATWKQYPEYAVNDVVQVNTITDPATGRKTQRVQQSFLVEIPETQTQGIVGGAAPAANDGAGESATPSLLNPMGPAGTPGGTLKRIGP